MYLWQLFAEESLSARSYNRRNAHCHDISLRDT